MKRIIFISVVLFAGMIHSVNCYSQHDPMFTNYMWNEMFINPAYAGSRDAVSFVALSRQQWVGIDGAPSTQTLSVQGPLFENKVGLGLGFMHESIGVTNETSLMGTFAYHINVSKKGRLAFGLSGGVIASKEQLADVVTETPGDEQFKANSPLLLMPNAGYGMYYYTKRFYAGVSIPRLMYNDVTPGTWDVKNSFKTKDIHYNLISGYVFNLKRGILLKPTIMCRTAYAAPLEVSTSVNVFIKNYAWVGVAYRSSDAISALLTLQITPNLRLGYSFDYTTSKLGKYNSGTHEISIGYDYPLGKTRTASPRLF